MWHDVEQNTEEWLAMRARKVTASGLNKVMANYGKAFGEPAKAYAAEIALQQITGVTSGGGYSNAHMERGHEEEPIALMEYESTYFCDVTNGGFFDNGDTGTSPDGLVGAFGVTEVKSAIAPIHFKRIQRQSYDPTYKWQLVGHLKFSDRDWVDFISYCSSFPEGKKLYVHRSTRDDFKEEFKMIDERLPQFFKMVEDMKNTIISSKYSLINSEITRMSRAA